MIIQCDCYTLSFAINFFDDYMYLAAVFINSLFLKYFLNISHCIDEIPKIMVFCVFDVEK